MLDSIPSAQADEQEWVDFKPLDNIEPEISVYPRGKDVNKIAKKLSRLKEHAGKIMDMQAGTRDYREYAFSVELRLKNGRGFPYSTRMRCALQDMPDGTVLFTNRQLTFKSPGNAADRSEIETEDNLRSMSVQKGLTALYEKYGHMLPRPIAHLSAEDVYVHSVCINSRIGYDGVLTPKRFDGDAKFLMMLNEDRVRFTAPQIVNSTGKLIDLGIRPEAEAECKKAILRKAIAETRTATEWNSSIIDATQSVGDHFAMLFAKNVPYRTNKVEEAGVRVDRKSALISNVWCNAAEKRYMQPHDYERADMQLALKALLRSCPSPFVDHRAEMTERAQMIADARKARVDFIQRNGYDINL